MSHEGILAALRIENLAIVDRTEILLGPGLTVLTGETGAGKSILVEALSLILGGRADTELVRSGASEAVVEALFELPEGASGRARFERAGFDVSGGEVVVRRVVGRSGRGRVTLNGQMATVSMLAELTRGLLDVSGQHEHVSLLDAERHLELVDGFGRHGDLLSGYEAAHAELTTIESSLAALQLDESEKARREDFLRFQLEEITGIDPAPGELETLEIERRRLQHAGRLSEATRRAEAKLYSEDGAVVELLGRVQVELAQLIRLDERLGPLVGTASTALAELEDLAQALGRYSRTLEADPGRLVEVDERVEAIKRLTRKHGGNVESVLEARDAMALELDAITHQEARRGELSAAREGAEARRAAIASRLTEARRTAARALEAAVQAELASLSMGGTQVELALHPVSPPGPRGAERAELGFSPNPGEPIRPLAKTASGGELSRVLLAFKRVLSEHDRVASYVFDEVDSGVGGAVADVLGRKLAAVARDRQVLCITHLPQVAAYGAQHWHVRKSSVEGRTVSRVVSLAEAEVVEEIARMLGGAEITERTRRLAEEMRARARAEAMTPREDVVAGGRRGPKTVATTKAAERSSAAPVVAVAPATRRAPGKSAATIDPAPRRTSGVPPSTKTKVAALAPQPTPGRPKKATEAGDPLDPPAARSSRRPPVSVAPRDRTEAPQRRRASS